MKFSSKREIMRVSTIRGDVNTIEGVMYQCQIADREGNIEEFAAY